MPLPHFLAAITNSECDRLGLSHTSQPRDRSLDVVRPVDIVDHQDTRVRLRPHQEGQRRQRQRAVIAEIEGNRPRLRAYEEEIGATLGTDASHDSIEEFRVAVDLHIHCGAVSHGEGEVHAEQ